FYLVQRDVLGVEDMEPGPMVPSERKWLVFYSIASFLYRTFIMAAIIVFIASSFFFIGVVLAIWTVVVMFGVPAAKGFWSLITSPVLRRCRRRALATSGALATVVVGLGTAVPVPYGTGVKGTGWVTDQAVVYANADGLVSAVLAKAGSWVTPAQPLTRQSDPTIVAERMIAEAETREYSLRLNSIDFADPVKAAIVREQLLHTAARRDRLAERMRDLTVRSEMAGQLILPYGDDLIG